MAQPAAVSLPANIMAPTSPIERTGKSLLGELEKANALGVEAVEDKAKAIQGTRTEIDRQRATTKQFALDNPFPKPDVKPFTEKPPENDPIKSFGSWASAIGILAGAITKRGIASSLNASAAAMTALNENNWAAYEEAKESWQMNTELAIKQADWEVAGYQNAFNLMEKDFEQGLLAAQTVAAEADNKGMLAALQQGNVKILHDMQQSLATFAAEGPQRQWNATVYNTQNAAVQARTKEFIAANPQATPEQLAVAVGGFVQETQSAMQALTPTQQMDAARYKSAINMASELNRAIPPETPPEQRAVLEAGNLKKAADTVGLMSGATTSLMNQEILNIKAKGDALRLAAKEAFDRGEINQAEFDEKILQIDRAESEERSRLSRSGEGGRGQATLRNAMNSRENAELHLEALDLLLQGNADAIGAAAQVSTVLQSVVEQLPDGVDGLGTALKDKALMAEHISQIANMTRPFLSQVYGGSSQWSKDRKVLVETLLDPDAILAYPDKAKQAVKTLKASLQTIEKTQERSAVRPSSGFSGLEAPKAATPTDNIPSPPAGVPASAQYSPSKKEWWWQDASGAWQMKKAE